MSDFYGEFIMDSLREQAMFIYDRVGHAPVKAMMNTDSLRALSRSFIPLGVNVKKDYLVSQVQTEVGPITLVVEEKLNFGQVLMDFDFSRPDPLDRKDSLEDL